MESEFGNQNRKGAKVDNSPTGLTFNVRVSIEESEFAGVEEETAGIGFSFFDAFCTRYVPVVRVSEKYSIEEVEEVEEVEEEA
jgi:hypothetical protein